MAEVRPLVAERDDVEPGSVDDVLVLGSRDRADGVDDRPAGTDTFRRGVKQVELELREGPRTPAEVRSSGKDAEAGTRRVHQRPVEARELGRQPRGVGPNDRHVVRAEAADVLLELAGPALVDLDRDDLAGELGRLPTGRGAEFERPLALAAADGQAGELRAAALRPDPSLGEGLLVDPLDAVSARNVGRLSGQRTADEPHDRLRRLVLGAHQGQCLVGAELVPPELGDPVRIRVLERRLTGRSLRQGRQQRADSVGQPPHDGVRERDGALEPSPANELDGLVDGRMARDPVGEPELVGAQAKRRLDGRIELPHRSATDRLDRVVQRAYALHGAEREPLCERAVARIQALCGRTKDAVGVRVVLEHAQDDLVRRLPGCHRRPRRYSAYVIRRRPSGCTSISSSSPSTTRVRQTVRDRPSIVALAPMCGESARTRLWTSTAGRDRSSSRSAAVIFSAYVTPSSGCGRNSGFGSTSSINSTATSAARAKTAPASSSAPIPNARCAAIGPASSSLTVSWMVTPVSASPAMIDRSTGAAPRQRGSSEGCTLSQSGSSSRLSGISRP